MTNLLLTGSSGFVGRRFRYQNEDAYKINYVSLQRTSVSEIDFEGVDTILHLAGIAHKMEKTEDSLFYDVNFKLTKEFAIMAKEGGVRHFIYMSSIKAYGNTGSYLTLESPLLPDDAYGKSKLMAEEALQALESDDFKVAIIRPPLIYGPGVKGNMKRLIELVEKRKIIPLGNIENKRSMVSVDNLIFLTNRIIDTQASGVYLVQDQDTLSTTELMRYIAEAKSVDIKLISIPGVFRALIKLLKPGIYKRVFGSLVVDDSVSRSKLDFVPPVSIKQGIEIMTREK